MADRDSLYRLQILIEFDDAYVGGKRTGKRGRGTAGKRLILIAVEDREKTAGFMAIEAVDTISQETVHEFLCKYLKEGQTVRRDAFPALNSVNERHDHQKMVVPPEEASKWLPLVHVVIGNLKKLLNGRVLSASVHSSFFCMTALFAKLLKLLTPDVHFQFILGSSDFKYCLTDAMLKDGFFL